MEALRKQRSTIGKALFYMGWLVIILAVIGFLISLGTFVGAFAETEALGQMLGFLVSSLVLNLIAGFVLLGLSELIHAHRHRIGLWHSRRITFPL